MDIALYICTKCGAVKPAKQMFSYTIIPKRRDASPEYGYQCHSCSRPKKAKIRSGRTSKTDQTVLSQQIGHQSEEKALGLVPQSSQPKTSQRQLLQCPICQSLVQPDGLDQHRRDVHRKQEIKRSGKKAMQSQPATVALSQRSQQAMCRVCDRMIPIADLANHQRSHEASAKPPMANGDQALSQDIVRNADGSLIFFSWPQSSLPSQGVVQNADGSLTFEDDCVFIEWLRSGLMRSLLHIRNLKSDDQLIDRYGSRYGLNIDKIKDRLLIVIQNDLYRQGDVSL